TFDRHGHAAGSDPLSMSEKRSSLYESSPCAKCYHGWYALQDSRGACARDPSAQEHQSAKIPDTLWTGPAKSRIIGAGVRSRMPSGEISPENNGSEHND